MSPARLPQDLPIHTTWSRGDDAHQPHRLNPTRARPVAAELGIEEVLLFPPSKTDRGAR
jgi:hypothetical protein